MDELFEFRDLEVDVDVDVNIGDKFNSRYMRPQPCYEIPEKYLKYKNAEKLAKEITIEKNERQFIFVDGTFIFGDFIEAFFVKKNVQAEKLTISTLSMSQANVDSLANLINGNYVKQLNLIVSDYFYSHERNDLIPYIYDQLDIDNKFQLAVAASHCKIATFETTTGKKILMHGSANLRSSSNIEQFVIEENEKLYTFVDEVNENILKDYATINKSLRRTKLWQAVVKNGKGTTGNEVPQQQEKDNLHLTSETCRSNIGITTE